MGKGGVYAVVEIGGKQFELREGAYVYVPLLKQKPQSEVLLRKVLMLREEGAPEGRLVLSGVEVKAKVLEHVKADKVLVFKKKRRKGYQVKRGHRQDHTKLLIEQISLKTRKTASSVSQ